MNGQSPEMGALAPEEARDFKFEELSFEQLQAAREQIDQLARTSFMKAEDGFETWLEMEFLFHNEKMYIK